MRGCGKVRPSVQLRRLGPAQEAWAGLSFLSPESPRSSCPCMSSCPPQAARSLPACPRGWELEGTLSSSSLVKVPGPSLPQSTRNRWWEGPPPQLAMGGGPSRLSCRYFLEILHHPSQQCCAHRWPPPESQRVALNPAQGASGSSAPVTPAWQGGRLPPHSPDQTQGRLPGGTQARITHHHRPSQSAVGRGTVHGRDPLPGEDQQAKAGTAQWGRHLGALWQGSSRGRTVLPSNQWVGRQEWTSRLGTRRPLVAPDTPAGSGCGQVVGGAGAAAG